MLRLLSKDPADRPQSASEVQRAIEEIEGFGEWTDEHAAKWWKDLGPDVRRGSSGTLGTADTKKIAVDLGRRT